MTWAGPHVRPWMLAAVVTADATRWLGRPLGGEWQDVRQPPDIIVPVGSLSKLVGSVVALRLAADGVLDLRSPASNVRTVHGFRRPVVGELMTHTAGLLPVVTVPVAATGPGTQWCYSNAGYCALAAEIAGVTGEPFRRTVVDLIHGSTGSRLGMSFGRIPESGFELVRQRVVRVPYLSPRGGWPSYGMAGSPEDVARFVAALALDQRLRAILDRLREPSRWCGGALPFQGIGARRRYENGRVWAAHGGQWIGYSHYVAVTAGAAVLVLSNYRDNGGCQVRHAAHTLMADALPNIRSALDTPESAPTRSELAVVGPAVLSMGARGSLGRRVRIALDRTTGVLHGRREVRLTAVSGFPGLWEYVARGEHRHLSFTAFDSGDVLVAERPGCIYAPSPTVPRGPRAVRDRPS